jgi:energy-converting hydrogenase Eha subunit A
MLDPSNWDYVPLGWWVLVVLVAVMTTVAALTKKLAALIVVEVAIVIGFTPAIITGVYFEKAVMVFLIAGLAALIVSKPTSWCAVELAIMPTPFLVSVATLPTYVINL